MEDAQERSERRVLAAGRVGADCERFWAERRFCLLGTVAADGTPHVVAVGVTVDIEAGLAQVIRVGVRRRSAMCSRTARVVPGWR
jgi:predicted pyridoxine 5'-phosphate oxidase superfamily flavin-nucleotide-binding protein